MKTEAKISKSSKVSRGNASIPFRRALAPEAEVEQSLQARLSFQSLPPAVNWHFWPHCNYGCKFCFASFEDLPKEGTLSREKALQVPTLLAQAGAQKITFVGGEPMLCKHLPDLLEEAKRNGLTTCMVTNATNLTDEFLELNSRNLDWVGISIDASKDELHAKIGRANKRDLSKGVSHHLSDAELAWERCRVRGIRMKLNTVVTRHNQDDDMRALVIRLKPERWKAFQVLPVAGQNDAKIDDLLISRENFRRWVNRHEEVRDHEISFIAEDNDLMRGSYAMLDALGRFYDSSSGGHRYSRESILVSGVEKAWGEVSFDLIKFTLREGDYDWDEKNGNSTHNKGE